MAYRFKQKVESLKTGRGYKVGSIVPDGLIAPDFLDEMIASGDIEKTGLIVEPEIIEEVIEAEEHIMDVGGSSWVETEMPKSKTVLRGKKEE